MKSIAIQDFLRLKKRKILFTDQISLGNALIQRYCLKEHDVIQDIYSYSTYLLAKEVVSAYYSSYELKNIDFIDTNSSVYLLYELLEQHSLSYIDQEILTLKTVKEIYTTINKIRGYNVSESIQKDQTPQMRDLLKIIALYERELEKTNQFDNIRTIQEGIWIMEMGIQNKISISFLIPWIQDAVFADLETNERKGIQNDFFSAFLEAVTRETNGQFLRLMYLPNSSVQESIDRAKVKWKLVSAYGQYNEVQYIIDEILKHSNRRLDEYNLFFTSNEYENLLLMQLEGRKIPFEMKDCFKASNTEYVQFMLSLIQYAKNDFFYKDVLPILQNPLFSIERVLIQEELKKKINLYAPYSKMDLNGLGWGKEFLKSRLEDLIQQNETKIQQAEDKKISTLIQDRVFYLFLQELLTVFDEAYPIDRLYQALLDFAKKYTYEKKDFRSYKELVPLLTKQKIHFAKLSESFKGTFLEKLVLIEKFLNGFQVSYVPNYAICARHDVPKINIYRLNRFQIINRPYNVFLGFSNSQTHQNQFDSVLLPDYKIEQYIEDIDKPLNIQTVSEIERLIEKNILTIEEGEITISYPHYDPVSLRELSPSLFVLKIQGLIDQNDLCLSSQYRTFCSGYRSSRSGWIQPPEKKREEPKEQADETIELSASQLQKMLECPLQYLILKNNFFIKIPSILEKNAKKWLSPVHKGNLFHKVAERYVQANFPPACHEPLQDLNLEDFERIYEEEIENIKKIVPIYSIYAYEREREDLKNKCEAFFKKMHESWREEWKANRKWEVVGCELDFSSNKDLYLLIPCENGQTIKVRFNQGAIDRVDGYVDENNELHLRLIDYKTGNKNNKQKEIEEQKQIQHFIYTYAVLKTYSQLISYGNDEDPSLLGNFKNHTITQLGFPEFDYVFPFEKCNQDLTMITPTVDTFNKDCFYRNGQLELHLPDPVNDLMKLVFEGGRTVDEISSSLKRYMIEKANTMISDDKDLYDPKVFLEKFNKNCGFCSFKTLCRIRCDIGEIIMRDNDYGNN